MRAQPLVPLERPSARGNALRLAVRTWRPEAGRPVLDGVAALLRFLGVVGVEAGARVAVEPARQPVQRQPPPDRGLPDRRARRRPGRPGGRVPLRGPRACAGASLRPAAGGLGRVEWNLPERGVLVGFSSIWWRESWKYGERAFRYCQHDVGHAIAAVALAAAVLGWSARLLEGLGDEEAAALLGLRSEGIEAERPDLLLALFPSGRAPAADTLGSRRPPGDALRRLAALPLAGEPNHLSSEHQPWPVIEEAAGAARRPPGLAPPPPGEAPGLRAAAGEIARRLRGGGHPPAAERRGHGRRHVDHLRGIRPDARADGRRARTPALRGAAREGARRSGAVRPPRRGAGPRALPPPARGGGPRGAAGGPPRRPGGAGEGPPGAIGRSRLAAGDVRAPARTIACLQEIASDGAFALAMLAEFEGPLREHGAWFYRRLH